MSSTRAFGIAMLSIALANAEAAAPTGQSGVAHESRTVLPPARDDHLLVGIELDRVRAVSLEVPEEAVLGAAEREERHGCRDADVHAQHARLDAIAILTRPFAARGEDARRVAQLVTAHDGDRVVE